MLDVSGTEDLLFQSLLQGSAENLRPMVLQDVMKPIDVVKPLPGSAMNDLGEVEECRLSQLQQLLALQIALPSLAGDRCHHCCTMRSKRRSLVRNEFARVDYFVSARHDAHPMRIQI